MSELSTGLRLAIGTTGAIGALVLAGCDSSGHHEAAPTPSTGESPGATSEPSASPITGIRCESLTLFLVDDVDGTTNNFMARVLASEHSGATTESATIDFGDGFVEVIEGPREVVFSTTKPHHFAPGTYTVKASVQGEAAGEKLSDTNDNCETSITIG
jgi:hypothetical protein